MSDQSTRPAVAHRGLHLLIWFRTFETTQSIWVIAFPLADSWISHKLVILRVMILLLSEGCSGQSSRVVLGENSSPRQPPHILLVSFYSLRICKDWVRRPCDNGTAKRKPLVSRKRNTQGLWSINFLIRIEVCVNVYLGCAHVGSGAQKLHCAQVKYAFVYPSLVNLMILMIQTIHFQVQPSLPLLAFTLTILYPFIFFCSLVFKWTNSSKRHWKDAFPSGLGEEVAQG